MFPAPSLSFATPTVDIESGNDILALVIDTGRWNLDLILECSLIFKRESAYTTDGLSIDSEVTAILLANNSLHYGRTTDLERFYVAYDGAGQAPIGVGFGSLGAPQSWVSGLGPTINIPTWVPALGGHQITTFKDDQPLTSDLDPRVISHHGLNLLPWSELEADTGANSKKLYISTPNHMFDFRNRNATLEHSLQRLGVGAFERIYYVPSPDGSNAEEIAKSFPDESDSQIRNSVKLAARTLFNRDWLF